LRLEEKMLESRIEVTPYEKIRNLISEFDKISKSDDENLHSAEDGIHMEFIRNVHLLSSEEIEKLQIMILEIEKMDFARWCA